MTKYYFANWKMYQSLASVKKFIEAYNRDVEFQNNSNKTYIGIAASYEHLYFLHQKTNKTRLNLGAQDCSEFIAGAYTGQVSIQSLVEMKADFCIIGHSEVRQYLQQTNAMVASKFKLLLSANISPIVCIGETLTQKQNGITLETLYDQLEPVLECLQSCTENTKIFIAYEPIYAIGTGLIPDLEELQQIFYFLKKLLKEVPVAKNVMFLYGGSVSSQSVLSLQNIDNISGFLIGKASIDFQELKKIVELE